jgi:predicted Zn-dependent protease
VNGWFNLALACHQVGKPAEAVAALDRARALRGITADQKIQIEQLKRLLEASGTK